MNPKLQAGIAVVSVFVLAIVADVCFHTQFYVLAVASVVSAIIAIFYSVILINRALNIETDLDIDE